MAAIAAASAIQYQPEIINGWLASRRNQRWHIAWLMAASKAGGESIQLMAKQCGYVAAVAIESNLAAGIMAAASISWRNRRNTGVSSQWLYQP